jgi:multidrug efflux pump subunit AcrB
MKLVFHADTNMNQAMAEVVAQVNRSRAFMPPGAVPPCVVRFDAGSVPVGQLVFSSPTRSPGEMQDIAINRVRPLFATLPGVSAPPPFGGNQRSIVVRVDPERLRSYDLTPEEVVTAVSRANAVLPPGRVRVGDEALIASTNTVIGADLSELANAPIRQTTASPVYIRDVATVENGTDIVSGYAHIDGRRTVYIPVTKRADASTLDVVARVREALPAMQAVVPDDVTVSLEFDQSGYVRRALRSVVLVFLRDWRSVLLVVTTIPIALLSAVVGLWLAGQTLNIMTWAGLATRRVRPRRRTRRAAQASGAAGPGGPRSSPSAAPSARRASGTRRFPSTNRVACRALLPAVRARRRPGRAHPSHPNSIVNATASRQRRGGSAPHSPDPAGGD